MQLQRVMSAVLGMAVTGLLLLAACGEDLPGPRAACTSDTSCLSGELCHPTAKVCVKSCTDGTECPSSESVCATMTGASGKFCQCTTTEKCGGGMGSTAICSTTDSICMTKCGSSADCGGRTCDTATGECLNSTSTLGKPCNATAAQPDICGNGQYCTGSSPVCTAVTAPTCPSFTGSSTGATWLSSNNAPVIYEITRQSITSNASYCGGGIHFVAHIKAYWKGGNLPTTSTELRNIVRYVRSDGMECTYGEACFPNLDSVSTSSGGQNTEFNANFCRPAGSSLTLTIGMRFVTTSNVTGNEACGTIQ